MITRDDGYQVRQCEYCIWEPDDEPCTIVERRPQPIEYYRTHGRRVRVCSNCIKDLYQKGELDKCPHSGQWKFVVDFTGQAQF